MLKCSSSARASRRTRDWHPSAGLGAPVVRNTDQNEVAVFAESKTESPDGDEDRHISTGERSDRTTSLEERSVEDDLC
jgi:hypothetical protein